MSVALAGFVMLLAPVSMAFIGIPAVSLTGKFGCMSLCNTAAVIIAVGLLVLVFSVVLVCLPLLFAGLLMLGLGMGLNEGPSMQRITVHSPRELQGSSGGLIFTVMNIGCIFGVAVFSVAASLGSGSGEVYTDQGVAIACIVGFMAAVFAYAASCLARDQIRC